MEIDEYYNMLDLSRRRINNSRIDTKRFLLDKIDWRDRLISITGSRGTGKTTLILQQMQLFTCQWIIFGLNHIH